MSPAKCNLNSFRELPLHKKYPSAIFPLPSYIIHQPSYVKAALQPYFPYLSLSSLSNSFAFVAKRFQVCLRMSGSFHDFSKWRNKTCIIGPYTRSPASWFLFPLDRFPMAASVMFADPKYAHSSSKMNIFMWLCSLYRNSKFGFSRSCGHFTFV